MLKMIHYFRSVLITLFCVATPAIACSPPPNWRPPSVEELFEKATYVIYAKAIAIENSPDGKRARVDILETFKGPALKSIGAPGEGCGLTISIGETRVFFLDNGAAD